MAKKSAPSASAPSKKTKAKTKASPAPKAASKPASKPAAKSVSKPTGKSSAKAEVKTKLPAAKAIPKATKPAEKSEKSENKSDKKAPAAKKTVEKAKLPKLAKAKITPLDKTAKTKKANPPSVMGSKPKKDADEIEDEFLDDDIEIDPELAEFVEDVAELEAADEELVEDKESEEADEEEAAPLKKSPKEKSASERRIKKERDLLAGIDRNGDLSEIWQKFYEAHKSEKPKAYNMRETFEPKSPLQHVKLGWGFILSNINDRLEVLFKEGIKILISNYKA